jgi:hypothetical protein
MKMADKNERFFVLHPKLDFDFIPKEIQVIFVHDSMAIPHSGCNQAVTTCLFRDGLDVIGFGWAIENPNDVYDYELGIQFAFKKAIRTMYKHLAKLPRTPMSTYHQERFKVVDKAFRTALYKARNKND